MQLEVDDRERQIFPFLPQYFPDGECAVRRLARGDYSIVARRAAVGWAPGAGPGAEPDAAPGAAPGAEPDAAPDAAPGAERLCAVIERKTLKDLAGSLKDGRLENLEGLVEVRRECGCDLWLLVEGPAFPAAGSRFGRIPFETLESLVVDASVRDGFFTGKAKDLADSARFLRKLCDRYRRSLELADVAGGAAHARGLTLTRRVRKLPNEAERVAQMWGGLPGVSPATGLILVGGGSVADWLARGPGLDAALAGLRYPGGAALAARARASVRRLLAGDADACAQFYRGAVGIAPEAAAALAQAGHTPAALLAQGPAAAGRLVPPGRKTKLGAKRVSDLIDLLRYQCAPAAIELAPA